MFSWGSTTSHRAQNWVLVKRHFLRTRRPPWLVLGSIVFNYLAALAIARRQGTSAAHRVLVGTVCLNLAMLGVFKYAGFAVANLNALMASFGLRPFAVPEVLLPIGISFFTFHAISYVVDVYRRDASAQKHPVEAALYLLVFPQLIAGPIIRYRQIAAQLTLRTNTTSDFAYGVRRFVIGLSKKMLIANTLAGPADQIFGMPPGQVTAAHAWIGVACYTLQIYFDFSGYSDMAIGLGRMFGFQFPENFAYPYVAASVQDFWRRWHMSLSAWFRDYVYVPLGGNRTSAARTYSNLVLVFFLCGLWHGASWTFVVWGLFHGAFLVIERAGLAGRLARLPRPVRHAYLLVVVMISWTFFRAATLPDAVSMIGAMFGRAATARCAARPLSTEPRSAPWLRRGHHRLDARRPWVADRWRRDRLDADEHRLLWVPSLVGVAALFALLAASLSMSAAQTYNPFIYFRF